MHTCKKAQLGQAMHDSSDSGLDMWMHAARNAHRTHNLRQLLQLANSQGLQQLNAAQRLDQSLAISFARGHNCLEGVGIQLKQNACNSAGSAFLKP